jgi:hypothetical protein
MMLWSLGLVLLPHRLLAQLRGQPAAPDLHAAMVAYADVILPADQTPSASQLGSHRQILERAARDQRFRSILEHAVARLDTQCRLRFGRGFLQASAMQRHALVEEIAARPLDDLHGWFFHATRAELFQHYYAHPASWSGLGIDAPPQPVGYPDAMDPPQGSKA